MAILHKLKAFQFNTSRRLLFSWIKPTILGCDRENLGLSDDDLVCYVLPFRSIADLQVLDKACELNGLPRPTDAIEQLDEERAFFFLGHPEGTFGRKTLRQQSMRMTRLFDHQTEQKSTIKIVPVSFFWGHQPEREKSSFKLLLSENWSATSRVKKTLAMIFHPGHILVQFGTPVNLKELMASEEERPRQIRKLLRLLRVHFNQKRQAIIGPDLSHRRTLLNTILTSREVRTAIEREANHLGVTYASVEKKARKYAHEIASDQSYRVIRFFDVLLTWLWNNLYDGIEVNDVDRAKRLAESCEVIYIPCHRSHIDYLLLSYVLYHNGLTPPHIAAGKNLNLPLIGPLLRRAGAFFMRRTFQGDQLYKEVFDEYLHQMFTKGYSVEYFIEGGRSRTGRTLPPRTGMLSMTVRSFQKNSGKPIAFLPVYFGYERVIESTTYMAELSGNDKKSESFFDVFKIFGSFKHAFGEVTVNFGEPVILRDFLDEHMDNWEEPDKVAPTEFSASCMTLAKTLATRINTAVAIKATSLVALALLSTTRQSIEETHLKDQIRLLMDIARGCGPGDISITKLDIDEILDEAIDIIGLQRSTHQFGNIISASPQQAVTLTYNANNVIHVYALPSLVCRFIRVRKTTDEAELQRFVAGLFPYLKAEMYLPWECADLPDVIRGVTNCLNDLGIIRQEGRKLFTPPPESRDYNCLQDLSRMSDATLERFYIVIALLKQVENPSSRQLEVAASGIAEQLSVVYGINSPDFFERSLFTTFLGALKTEQLVVQEESELKLCPAFAGLEENAALTMDPDVRYNILQAVRTVPDVSAAADV